MTPVTTLEPAAEDILDLDDWRFVSLDSLDSEDAPTEDEAYFNEVMEAFGYDQ
jgi:hypothetical protein